MGGEGGGGGEGWGMGVGFEGGAETARWRGEERVKGGKTMKGPMN